MVHMLSRQFKSINKAKTRRRNPFAPCLHEEADTRIFARATEASKRPNKKISSCAVDTDVVLWCNSSEWMNYELGKYRQL